MADTIIDNSLATAQSFQVVPGSPFVKTDSLGGNNLQGGVDTQDHYRFTLNRSSGLAVKLTDLQGGDANVELFDSSGNRLVSSNGGTLADGLLTPDPLNPNTTYYIRVFADNPTTTISYRLTVESYPSNRADLVWRNTSPPANSSNGRTDIWRMNGANRVASQTLSQTVSSEWRLEAVGDMDGDGNDDIIWHNINSQAVRLWLMDASGTARQSEVILPNVSSAWYVGGLGDFNADGKLDIYWRNSADARASVWAMNGASYSTALTVDNSQNPAWVVEAVGDFDNDGERNDLFFRNLSTGANGIWRMNRTTLQQSINMPTVTGNWRMEGTGDFNSDGFTDLVWRNYSTGRNDVWFMQGTTSLSSVTLPPVTAGQGWQIAGVLTSGSTPDLAGSTVATAFDIGRLSNATGQYTEQVGPADSLDIYKVTLRSPAEITTAITGQGVVANANLTIRNAVGAILATGAAANNSTTREAITEFSLAPGDYYIWVQSASTVRQDYTLSVGATVEDPVNLFFTSTTPAYTGSVTVLGPNNTPPTPPALTTITVQPGTTTTLAPVESKFRYEGRDLSSEGFEIGYYLSTDATFNQSDERLNVSVGSATPNALTVTGQAPTTGTSEITVRADVILPPKSSTFWDTLGNDTYYIFAVLDPDNEIEEADAAFTPRENDNNQSTRFEVDGVRNADLTISNSNFVVQTSAVRGGTITLNGAINNIGDANSNAKPNPSDTTFLVEFYLANDDDFNSASRLLLTSAEILAPVPKQGSVAFNTNQTSQTYSFTSGTDPIQLDSTWINTNGGVGQYYIFAVVNSSGNLAEIDNQNSVGINNVVFDTINIT
jgi:hypothetical protein